MEWQVILPKTIAIVYFFASIIMGQTASMPDTVAFVGGNVSIPVTINDVVDLEGLEFTVEFDETILTSTTLSFDNTELDDINYNVSVGSDNLGEIIVAIFAAGSLYSGSGNIIFINFDVLGDLSESTDLVFTSIEINNISILGNSKNGSVTLNNSGCMDIDACNYNENASIDDGSCEFKVDCAGQCGGSAFLDECEICSGGESAHYANSDQDCNGLCFGTNVEDACGVCGGDGSDDLGCGCFEPGPSGCDNICGSTLTDDECGVCGGSNIDYNGWQLALTDGGNFTGCVWELFEEGVDFIYPDGAFPTWQSCVAECQSVENCSAIEYADGSVYEEYIYCALWLNGSCNALIDDCNLQGCTSWEDDNGFYTYIFTGANTCDCDGNIDLGCGCAEDAPDECGICNGSGVDEDEDNICDDVDTCIEEIGTSQECGCNIGIADGSCDCDGNIFDECGVCNGPGIAEGACDCFGSVPEENHDCNGNKLSINNFSTSTEFKLFPNFPNPFNPITTISYSVTTFSDIELSIYSMSGNLIQKLVNSKQKPGYYAVEWDASNSPSGLYFVNLISEDKIAEQKIILIK